MLDWCWRIFKKKWDEREENAKTEKKPDQNRIANEKQLSQNNMKSESSDEGSKQKR